MMQECRVSKKAFEITEEDLAFYDKISPVFNGTKYSIPPPTLSPDERLRRRWTFRNERSLYNNRCAKTGRAVVAMFPPSLPVTIYDQDVWWDKNWDGTEYGRDFDLTKSFFEQFASLLRAIPHPNLLNDAPSNKNSDYVNCTISLKDCYMIFDAGNSEDCYYSNIIGYSKNCIDCTAVVGCEISYDLVGSTKCYNSTLLIDCENCRDSAFLYACKSCNDCFGCYNLRHKQYCWNNEQLTKEEFEKRKAALDLSNYDTYQKTRTEFLEFIKAAPREYAFLMHCENCTGNVIAHSHNNHASFDSNDNEDSKYTIATRQIRDSYDIQHTYNAELSLEIMAATNIYRNFFSFYSINSQDIFYSYLTANAKNCFGCAGLKNQEYCILNKKYSKEEYFALVERLKEHMRRSPLRSPDATFEGQAGEYGSFFPPHLSYFYYNQSEGMNYFPITKEEATKRGFAWFTEKVEDFVPTYTLPDHIRDVKDDVLHAVLRSEKSGKKYRMIKQELEFYRRMNVPPPHTSPMERIQENLKHTAILPLKTMKCSRHGETIETVYDSTKQQVYCEKCYQETIL